MKCDRDKDSTLFEQMVRHIFMWKEDFNKAHVDMCLVTCFCGCDLKNVMLVRKLQISVT